MNVAIIATYMSFHSSFNRHNIDLLNDMGHKVHVFGSDADSKNKKGQLDDFYSYCQRNSVTLHFVDIPRSPLKFIKIYKAYKVIIESITKNKIVFIHSHTPVGGFLGRFSSKSLSISNIYTSHGFHFFKGAPIWNWLLYFPIEKILSGFTDAVITINNEDYELSKKYFKSTSYLIQGVGIYYSDFYKNRTRKTSEELKLLSVGEINANKNHITAVKAFRFFNQKFSYKIAGDGVQKLKLTHKIQTFDMNNSVRLLGFVHDVKPLLWESDIFLMPSLREGLPVSIIEAMASGLPVIGSDIRGIRDLIDEGKGGYLFQKNNWRELRKILEELGRNPQLQFEMGQYNQEKARMYSFDMVKNTMEQIYKNHLKPV